MTLFSTVATILIVAIFAVGIFAIYMICRAGRTWGKRDIDAFRQWQPYDWTKDQGDQGY